MHAPTPARPSLARNVAVLAGCQALFFMCNTIVISAAALIGLQLAPAPALATVPLGLQFIGTMTATMPASLLMQQVGRRPGLMLGAALGILAGFLGWLAIMRASFLLFAASGVVYGAFSAFCQYYRFSAADAADAADTADPAAARARAVAWVLAGGVIAALLGPELAKATRDVFAPVLFAGCYAAVAALAALTLLLLALLDLPHARPAAGTGGGRPLLEIVRQPMIVTAFLAALVGYVTMNLLMTATPLAMLDCGFDFADTAFVIQWHVLGMFLPSFWTGSLIARFGAERIIATGALINLVCIAVNMSGLELDRFIAGLFLLGLGWNLMFIGGTTLLTACYHRIEMARVQGLNDLLLFTSVAMSAAAAGALHDLLGWQAMNLAAVPAVLLVLLRLWWRRPGAVAAARG
jgi:MFS family permease